MARNKIDPAISRKAYAAAEKRLKSLHEDEFALILDEAYAAEGVESPRVRRERLASEAAKAAAARRIAREEKKAEKIAALVMAGASRTMKSRHLTGHAVDLAVVVDGEIRWDWPMYKLLSMAVKAAASEIGVPVEWGGEVFGAFKDGPHFQLPWAKYPADWLAPTSGEVTHA